MKVYALLINYKKGDQGYRWLYMVCANGLEEARDLARGKLLKDDGKGAADTMEVKMDTAIKVQDAYDQMMRTPNIKTFEDKIKKL